MIELVLTILILSIFCNGVYLIVNFGNVLDPIRKWYIDISAGIENADGRINWTHNINFKYDHPKKVFFYKPLFGCVVCMASIWGTIGYWTIQLANHSINIKSLALWPIIIICVACGNLLVNRLYE